MSALDRGSFFSRSDLSDPIRQPLIRREPVSRMRLLARTGLILASEFCERMAFYSIAANLFFFMTNQMDLDADVGNIFLLAFVGTCYVSPLLGGYLADSFLGRFQTIVLFDVAYVVGMALLAGGTFMGPKDVHWLIYISLFTIALGTGGIKANVIPFGADQFLDVNHSNADDLKQTFFNWSYFMINLGALCSFTGIAYIQQEIYFGIGLAVPAGVLCVSLLLFSAGFRHYVKLRPAGSIIGPSLRMIYYAWRAPWDDRNNARTFLDRAKYSRDYTGALRFSSESVDHLKGFMRLVPILSVFIYFWCMYGQMAGMFLLQGTGLNTRLWGDVVVPVTANHVFNILAIIILVPIFDRLVYPGSHLGCCSLYSGFSTQAVYFEFRFYLLTSEKIAGKNYTAVDLSLFSQAPAFFLIGTGEVMAAITGIEFAYAQSPPTMKSILMASFYTTQALGYYLGIGLSGWIASSPNDSRLDYYFFLIAAIGLLNFFFFLFVAHRYKTVNYIDVGRHEKSSDGEDDLSSDTGLVGLD